jgi:lipopolysaccharide/colanic/teichoic acid biosynthesis glycosyltransferase
MAHWGFLRLFLGGDAGFWSKNGGRYVKLQRLGKIGKGKTCEKLRKMYGNGQNSYGKRQKMYENVGKNLKIFSVLRRAYRVLRWRSFWVQVA